MLGPKFHVEFCRVLKRAMVTCTAFPLLDGRNACQLRDFLARTSSDGSHPIKSASWFNQEIREYTGILASKQNLKTVFAFGIINLLVVIKYLYHVFVILREIDLHDLEQNVKVLESEPRSRNLSSFITGVHKNQQSVNQRQEVIFKFLCLQTNCTRLSHDEELMGREDLSSPMSGHLARDLHYLPMFSLCHPNLKPFYSPIADLGSIAIVVDCYISLLILITCIMYPAQQVLFNRASDESLLYIVAPNITIEMLCSQLERIHQCYLESLENFGHLVRASNHQRLAYDSDWRARPTSISTDTENLRRLHNKFLSSSEGHQRAPESGSSAGFATWSHRDGSQQTNRQFISECLPAVRTPWWREKIGKLYYVTFVSYTLGVDLPVAVGALAVAFQEIHRVRVRLVAYDEFMRRERCSIWFHDAESAVAGQRVIVNLAEFKIGWTLWDAIESAPPVACGAYLIVTLASQILIVINELACWLKEQRHDLLVLMELLRVRPLVLQEREALTEHARHEHESLVPAGTGGGRPIDTHGLSALRDLFVRHTRIRFGFVRSAPLGSLESHRSGPEIEIFREQLARTMLLGSSKDQGHELAHSTRRLLIGLSKKVYLNHQLFIRLIELYSTKVAALMLMANFGVYGTIAISALLSETSPDVIWMSYLLNSIFISLIILFISIVSNFHAESRKLQLLFWSLIARLREYESDDVELRHMRQLFTKQTLHLDRIGGLAISAFGFRVTYTNVIQIIAWSSTIVALYLKDH